MTITREEWCRQQEAKSLVDTNELTDRWQQLGCDQKLACAIANLYQAAQVNPSVRSNSRYSTQSHEVWSTQSLDLSPSDDSYSPFLCN